MYLDSGNKSECSGCEACAQACGRNSIVMVEDQEGFRYPIVNEDTCIKCGLCHAVCPFPAKHEKNGKSEYVFGGYHKDPKIRFESTSGGAFSAIVDAFCDTDYVVFGARADGLEVYHDYITDTQKIALFRKSKYTQSVIGNAYRNAERFLFEGKKVLFTGTPCQIAALKNYLGLSSDNRLLTVEVVCEGVPSPLYIRKIDEKAQKKYGAKIEELDYRYTGKTIFGNGKWDFQQMSIKIGHDGEERRIIRDRWLNPFWSIWLEHLMSRPSCYQCPFATAERVADITLGDLWGVHLYCPELYGKNGGASLVFCNTKKGKDTFQNAQRYMYGHLLSFDDAIQYQGPMRRPVPENKNRERFMQDLKSSADITVINKKWAKRPTTSLLFNKYIYGNRQKVFFWKFKYKIGRLLKKT